MYKSATTIDELKANPHICISATTGHALPERTPEERAETRKRIEAKAKAEAIAMQRERDRIERLHQPTYPLKAANDNNNIINKVAA